MQSLPHAQQVRLSELIKQASGAGESFAANENGYSQLSARGQAVAQRLNALTQHTQQVIDHSELQKLFRELDEAREDNEKLREVQNELTRHLEKDRIRISDLEGALLLKQQEEEALHSERRRLVEEFGGQRGGGDNTARNEELEDVKAVL